MPSSHAALIILLLGSLARCSLRSDPSGELPGPSEEIRDDESQPVVERSQVRPPPSLAPSLLASGQGGKKSAADFGREFRVILDLAEERKLGPRGSQVESAVTYSLDLTKYDKSRFGTEILVRPGGVVLANDAINLVLMLVAVYLCLFGFRIFRLLMLILGFFASYYSALLLLRATGVQNLESPGLQLSLLFGAVLAGFVLTVVCYVYDSYYYLVFGGAAGVMVGVVLAQFPLDPDQTNQWLAVGAAVAGSGALFAAVSYFLMDHVLILGSVLVGATQAPINFGVLLRDIQPFYDHQVTPATDWKRLCPYLVQFGVMAGFGLVTQYYLRGRIIRRLRATTLGSPDLPRCTRPLEDELSLAHIF